MKADRMMTDYWSSTSCPKHRRGLNDVEWASVQPQGAPAYMLGEVVEFKEGGFGMITEVTPPRGGWPSQYATTPVAGKPDHPKTMRAWFYEGDFARIAAPSPLRKQFE